MPRNSTGCISYLPEQKETILRYHQSSRLLGSNRQPPARDGAKHVYAEVHMMHATQTTRLSRRSFLPAIVTLSLSARIESFRRHWSAMSPARIDIGSKSRPISKTLRIRSCEGRILSIGIFRREHSTLWGDRVPQIVPSMRMHLFCRYPMLPR